MACRGSRGVRSTQWPGENGGIRVTEDELRMRVKKTLSPTRFLHVEGVVSTAERYARIHGGDVPMARIAAWIHDMAREWSDERLLEAAEGMDIPSGFAQVPKLLHGPIAAVRFRDWFGSGYPDVENAIRYHTTARTGMSNMEMILFLADGLEPGRDFPGVDNIRKLAEQDLLSATAHAIDSTLQYLIQRHHPIFPLTVMARNELWERIHQD